MTAPVPDELSRLDGACAPPRDNGELVFQAPWEARAVALAVGLIDRLELPWDEFRQRLIAAIADAPTRPYYESWAVALEDLVLALDLATSDVVAAAEPLERAPR